MGKWVSSPGRDGVLPPGVMGFYALINGGPASERDGCPAPGEMEVLPHVSLPNTGDGGVQPPALCPDTLPLCR